MGSLWTLPAPWTRRRAHRALDRPQTACPQRPQALISSLYKPGSLLRKACSAEFLLEAAGRARVSGRDAAFAGWQ